mmetsp:Transcript_36788/g.59465  ORF Transcript_36788/g.59465 Transcript_36788/m.59465 type:complete len:4129 (+) Transcript_36788:1953-14339(+)
MRVARFGQRSVAAMECFSERFLGGGLRLGVITTIDQMNIHQYYDALSFFICLAPYLQAFSAKSISWLKATKASCASRLSQGGRAEGRSRFEIVVLVGLAAALEKPSQGENVVRNGYEGLIKKDIDFSLADAGKNMDMSKVHELVVSLLKGQNFGSSSRVPTCVFYFCDRSSECGILYSCSSGSSTSALECLHEALLTACVNLQVCEDGEYTSPKALADHELEFEEFQYFDVIGDLEILADQARPYGFSCGGNTERKESVCSVDCSSPALLDTSIIECKIVSPRSERRDSLEDVELITPAPCQDGRFPLSMSQEVALENCKPAVHLFVKLGKNCDIAALRKAVVFEVNRHEILRTVFNQDGTQSVADVCFGIAYLREEEVGAFVERDFDLSVEAPIKVALYGQETCPCLVVVGHSAAFDNESMRIFAKELELAYDDFCHGYTPPGRSCRTIEFHDFASWEKQTQPSADSLEFWRASLSEIETLDLFTDKPRPKVFEPSAKTVCVELANGEFASTILGFTEEQDTTLYNVLLSAYLIYLSKMSRQDQVVVGALTMNRTHPQTRKMIGPFDNLVAVAANVHSDQSVREFIRHVGSTYAAALEHAQVPFEKVVDAVGAIRDTSRNPVFQVSFGVVDVALEYAFGAHIPCENVCTSGVDLDLQIERCGGKLNLRLTYATSLYLETSVMRMAENIKCIVGQMVGSASLQLKCIDPLSKSEHRLLLSNAGLTDRRNYVQDKSVDEVFEEQASKTPDAVALYFQGSELTYSELNVRATALADELMSLDCGNAVGVYLERSLETVISIIAVLKAGLAYVPISRDFPASRTEFIAEDSGIKAVIAVEADRESLSSLLPGVEVVAAEHALRRCGAPVARNPCPAVEERLAYIIYTSGTTGKPKGVLQTHYNVLRLLASGEQARLGFSVHDVWILLHNHVFDFSVWEMWAPLLQGGKLVIPSAHQAADVAALLELVHECGVSILTQTPTFFYAFSEYVLANGLKEKVASVSNVLFLGESLNVSRLQPWWDSFTCSDCCTFINLYGPTEATVFNTWKVVARDDPPMVNNIGAVLDDQYIILLDPESLNLVPIGCPGELFIGGAGLAIGYLNRSELTGERFIPNPLAPGQTIYKTGDMGKWLANGELEFLGRNDSQVKIRGFRIELGEIENVLLTLESVQQAVVIVHDEKLAAYIVAKDVNVDTAGLLGQLSNQLPEYMVPGTITVIEHVPRTVNGKLDVRALPAPTVEKTAYVSPTTELQTQLCSIWEDILSVSPIGIEDNFFTLGGTSIDAIRAAGVVFSELGLTLSISAIFAGKTIANIAPLLEDVKIPMIPNVECDSEGLYPLSFGQERSVFMAESHPDASSAYHVPVMFRLNQHCDTLALERALHFVVNRHDILRTAYRADKMKAFVSDRDLCIDYIDESAVPGFVAKPFDLSQGLPVSAAFCDVEDTAFFLVNIHHIAFDGWSAEVFVRELGLAYSAYNSGQVPELGDLDIQYCDFAGWERERVEACSGSLDFWREHLDGFEVLELLPDHPRPKNFDHSGHNVSLKLGMELSDAIKALAREHETTLFTVFLAANYILLSKMTGQDDVVIGTVTANRSHPQTQDMLGMFVNAMALRTTVDSEMQVSEFIKCVDAVIGSAKDHEHVPFERIVHALGVARDTSRHPIFQVTLGVSQTASAPCEFGQVVDDSHSTLYCPAKFDLSIFVTEDVDGLSLCFNYATSLFDVVTIEAMSTRFQGILEQMVATDTSRVGDLSIVSASEREHLLCGIGRGELAEYDDIKTMHGIFEHQVRATPDCDALVYEGTRLTYRELNGLANALARILVESECGEFVALYFDRSLEMVISILAVLKAGAAYIPISPKYPEERVGFILDEASVKVVVTQSQYAERFPGACTIEVVADQLVPEASNLDVEVDGSDVAYVIYTSGTTGKPKGVLVGHGNAANLAYSERERLFRPNNVTAVMAFCEYVFDVSVWDLFVSFCNGCKVVIANEDERRESRQLKDLILREAISLAALPAAVAEATPLDVLQCLKCVVVGGGVTGKSSLMALAKTCQVFNAYGPSECAVTSTWHLFQPGDLATNIGGAISNAELYVADKELKLVPVGVKGELLIGGAGVAKGYLKRPELTEERFISNPFGSGSQRLYRTGDQVRWLRHGELEFLGRNDSQVKIRGFRVELGEIENALVAVDMIDQAVVIVIDSTLHAYAACVAPSMEAADVLQMLSSQLPEYMVPSTLQFMERIPQTINGKVDVKALPKPDAGKDTPYTPPSTMLQSQLCSILERTLGKSPVGIHDNFFLLGGTSIESIKVAGIVHSELNLKLSVQIIFEQKTVANIVSKLEKSDLSLVPKAVCDENGGYPLSFGQERSIFITKFQENASNAYHIPLVFKLGTNCDFGLLERSLQLIVDRHEVLRTIYPGDMTQRVSNQVFSTCNIRADDVEAFVSSAFDLTKELPIRAALYEQDGATHLAIVTHHIAFDGWSVDILVEDMANMYDALCVDSSATFEDDLDIQYRDYAVWERDHIENCGESLDYWKDSLDGFEVLNLLTDTPRPKNVSYAGENVILSLGEQLSHQVKALALQEKTTLYTVLLSAYYILLSKMSGQDDVTIGTATANRSHPQAQKLIGFFVNTLAQRVLVDEQATVSDFIQGVGATLQATKAHEHVPFEKLVQDMGIVRDTSRHPIFQVCFGMNQIPTVKLPFGEFSDLDEGGYAPAKFDLSLFVTDCSDGLLSCCFNYATSLFHHESVQRIAERFRVILEQMVSMPGVPLKQVEAISSEERDLIVNEFGRGEELEYATDTTIHQTFESQVLRAPLDTALVFEGFEMTFKQLNERANALAARLVELECGEFVALYLDRGFDMYVSILGVLKAGAAYVPISPEFPTERTTFILEQTGATVVVTQDNYLRRFASLDVTPLVATSVETGCKNVSVDVSPSALAYVIFTSGTSGKPKGVMVTHLNVLDLMASQAKLFALDRIKSVLAFSAYVFDASVWELFVSLCYGHTIVIANEEERKDAGLLTKLMNKYAVKLATIPPALVETMSVDCLASLEYLVLAGEASKVQTMSALTDICNVYNAYGPTEITVCSSAHMFQPGDLATNIGGPLANTQLYVLDSCGHVAPIGVPGELLVGGPGVAKGYLGRPDLTSERFVLSGDTTLYKTGDLVRWLANGELEFLGRNDSQVKIRGFRIELGEVEGALISLSAIQQAVVVPHDGTLVAYVVSSEQGLDGNGIRDALVEQLPSYMIPSKVMFLDEIPRTINGKVDVRALPAPEEIPTVVSSSYVAPQTVLQSQLCKIWSDTLGVTVGIHDNFFAIGGTSIDSMRLSNLVHSELGMQLPVSCVFEQKTIENIAATLRASDLPLIPKVESYDKLSFGEERTIFVASGVEEGGSSAYHVPMFFRLEDNCNLDALRAALRFVIDRHHILRTVYNAEEMTQSVLGNMFSLDSIQRSELEHFVSDSFNLSNEIPIRGAICEDADDKHLVVVVHHIAFDGWSADIFVGELNLSYSAFQSGAQPNLEILEVQYRDFASWERDCVGSSSESLEFWKQNLDGFEILNLYTDKQRPADIDYSGADCTVKLSEDLSMAVKQLAQQKETTLFTVLLSAYYILLGKVSGQDDITIGTVTANRAHPQTQSMIGFFVNTLALRLGVDQKCELSSFIGQVDQALQAVKPHEHIPFDKIVQEVGVAREKSRHPIFQVCFGMNSTPKVDNLSFGEFADMDDAQYAPAKFDLNLTATNEEDCISLCFNYAVSLFHSSTIQRFADRFLLILEQMVTNPSLCLNQVDALSLEERSMIMNEFGPGKMQEIEYVETLHELFEEQAAKNPDAVALIFEGSSLTYGEMNERANVLAHTLIGMGSGTYVALYLPRKLDKDRKDMYFIHYQGWKQSTDCWVSELIPYTEQAKAKKEELDEEAEEYVRQVKEERMTRRRERHRAASKLAKAEEDAQPDTNGLRITLSATLKKILFEDFENITLKKMLLRIPRKPSVEQVLEEYIEYSQQDFGLCSPTGKVAPETAVQIVNGLTIFFERCIGPYLLYEFEKLQYDAIRERVPENENDVLLPDLANKKRKRLARMYGTEHLLRMFVKLPILFEGHKLLCGETETLHLVLHDILKFIAKCRDRYISPNAYEPASDDYLMIVQDL